VGGDRRQGPGAHNVTFPTPTPFAVSEALAGQPRIGNVIGTLWNHKSAWSAWTAAMTKAPYNEPPRAPVLYLKTANTWRANGQPVALPASVAAIEVGATLGLVIGRTASRVAEAYALDALCGYVLVNDLCEPHQNVFRPALRQRCRDGFCPISAQFIARGQVVDFAALVVRLAINGVQVMENCMSDLVRSPARLIADISEFMTLSPGDVLLAGVPNAPPLARAGDTLRTILEDYAVLDTPIVTEVPA